MMQADASTKMERKAIEDEIINKLTVVEVQEVTDAKNWRKHTNNASSLIATASG